MKMLSALENDYDVQNICANFEISDEVCEELMTAQAPNSSSCPAV